MVSLHGFSILILLTQSNHKSALLFSCTRPFSGAYGYYTTFFLKSQTYVHIFLRKIKKFFGVIHNTEGKRAERRIKTCRSPATKARPPRTPFRGGHFSRCVFFLLPPVWVRRFCLPFVRLRFGLFFRRELVCGGAKRRRTRL